MLWSRGHLFGICTVPSTTGVSSMAEVPQSYNINKFLCPIEVQVSETSNTCSFH